LLPAAVDAPAELVLNVNIPNRPLLEVRGVRRAPLASFGAVQTHITEEGKGYIDLTFSEIDPTGEPGSDATLLAEGFVTVTPLHSVCESAIDLPALSLP
jgi:5'-nucleotidase